MIEFGKTLRDAREAKGLSVAQLAETTHMAPTTVCELEAENFSRIAAPIYGRGFVKLYCEAVGLDPKPLVAEFMEIYNGNREPEIKERSVPAAPTEEAAAADSASPEPVADEAPPEDQREDTAAPAPEPDLFRLEPPPAEPVPPTREEPPQPPMAPVADEHQAPSLSRYAAPVRQAMPDFDPRAYLRLGILALGALLALGVVVYGIRAVYRATMPATVEAADEAVAVQPASQPPEPKATPAKTARATTTPAKASPVSAPKGESTPVSPAKKSSRIPRKVPSLYLD